MDNYYPQYSNADLSADAAGDDKASKPKSSSKKTPQASIISFWARFLAKQPSKLSCIFPPSLYADLLPPIPAEAGKEKSINAAKSYELAVKQCKDRVAKIVRECHRVNQKFIDSDFNIDLDKDFSSWNCLDGLLDYTDDVQPPAVDADDFGEAVNTLVASGVFGDGVNAATISLPALSAVFANGNPPPKPRPGGVHRVDWIFEDPKFTVDGFEASDIRQGSEGDCWFLAAVATLCAVPGALEKICVARDEECGVYGFVFFRDGEWIWTVVDENLYLVEGDWPGGYDPKGTKARKHRKNKQTGSDALYFASCEDQNETWLPLLEKAYAKIHGDFSAINGGLVSEAIEDLTGGVGSVVESKHILSKERQWKELVNENGEFMFSVGSYTGWHTAGLQNGHAYSILKAVEVEGQDGKKIRLLKLRYVSKVDIWFVGSNCP